MDESAPTKSKLGFGRRIFRRLSLLIAFVLFFSLASFLWIATTSVQNLYLTGTQERSSQFLRLLAPEARLALRKNKEGTWFNPWMEFTEEELDQCDFLQPVCRGPVFGD